MSWLLVALVLSAHPATAHLRPTVASIAAYAALADLADPDDPLPPRVNVVGDVPSREPAVLSGTAPVAARPLHHRSIHSRPPVRPDDEPPQRS